MVSRLGFGCSRIDGHVAPAERTIALDRFQKGEGGRVLLATLSTCAVGLTCNRANHAIIAEPWWNPVTIEQAMARVHRIGQERPTHCHILIAAGTLDEVIHGMCEGKAVTAADLLGDDESTVMLGADRNARAEGQVRLLKSLQAMIRQRQGQADAAAAAAAGVFGAPFGGFGGFGGGLGGGGGDTDSDDDSDDDDAEVKDEVKTAVKTEVKAEGQGGAAAAAASSSIVPRRHSFKSAFSDSPVAAPQRLEVEDDDGGDGGGGAGDWSDDDDFDDSRKRLKLEHNEGGDGGGGDGGGDVGDDALDFGASGGYDFDW